MDSKKYELQLSFLSEIIKRSENRISSANDLGLSRQMTEIVKDCLSDLQISARLIRAFIGSYESSRRAQCLSHMITRDGYFLFPLCYVALISPPAATFVDPTTIHIKLQLIKSYFASLRDFMDNYTEEDVREDDEDEDVDLKFCSDLVDISGIPFSLESWKLKLRDGASQKKKYYFRNDLVVENMLELRQAPPGIRSMTIYRCDKLEFLPSRIMHSLEFFSLIDCASLKAFPLRPNVLNTLSVRGCKQLELPTTPGVFPLLKMLYITQSCDSMVSFTLDLYPKLQALSFDGCVCLESLRIAGQEGLNSLASLHIFRCLNFTSFPKESFCAPKLAQITLVSCAVKSLPTYMHQLKSVSGLSIKNCPQLQLIPHGGLPASLETLYVSFSKKLTLGRQWGLDALHALSYLQIRGCVDLVCFPEEGLLPTNLRTLCLVELPNLTRLNENGLLQLTSLKELQVYACQRLHCFPHYLPRSLSSFTCKKCPYLNRIWPLIAKWYDGQFDKVEMED